MTALILPALVALAPVLCFLGLLLYLDSYKLLAPRRVLLVVAGGALLAGVAYFINAALLDITGLAFRTYSRHVAPLVEEALKALIVVGLMRARRVGFLVDAAIFGFAVGTGFALVENLVYLQRIPDATLGLWIVRGFGTAVMHGGTTAMLAVMALSVLERSADARQVRMAAFVPGLALATALHWGFNRLGDAPQLATLATLLVVPALLLAVFQRSEKRLADWLGSGFDADAQMLELINSGQFSDSPAGQYLQTLKQGFSGPMMADALCYVRLYTELSLRAKGLLMMRENGFPTAATDAETRSRLEELHFLEASIGVTGLRTLQPMLRMQRKDLWQINLLESA